MSNFSADPARSAETARPNHPRREFVKALGALAGSAALLGYDVSHGGRVSARAIVMQQMTQRPYNLTGQKQPVEPVRQFALKLTFVS